MIPGQQPIEVPFIAYDGDIVKFSEDAVLDQNPLTMKALLDSGTHGFSTMILSDIGCPIKIITKAKILSESRKKMHLIMHSIG